MICDVGATMNHPPSVVCWRWCRADVHDSRSLTEFEFGGSGAMDYTSETNWFSSLRRIRTRKSSASSAQSKQLPDNAKSMCDIASVSQVSPLRAVATAVDRKSTWRDKLRLTKKVKDKSVASATTRSHSIEMLNEVCQVGPVNTQFWSLPRRRANCSTPARPSPSRLRSHSSSTLVNNKRSSVWYLSPQRVAPENEVSFHGNAPLPGCVTCRWCDVLHSRFPFFQNSKFKIQNSKW